MTKLSVLVLLLALSYILAEKLPDAAVTETTNEFNVDDIYKGTYSFRYITPENIKRQETGYLDAEGNLIVNGFYSYYDPDGKQHYVSYHADKDGYRTYKLQVPVISVAAAPIDPNAVASLLG